MPTLYVFNVNVSWHSEHLKHALWYVNCTALMETATDSAGYADCWDKMMKKNGCVKRLYLIS